MARLFFPALNKLEADNERLRNRIGTLEADLLSKTKERNQSNQGYKEEMRSLLDENLNLQRKLREVTVEVEALRETVPVDEGDRSKTDLRIPTADCADFKWENRRLKDLLEKQTVDLKELRRLVDGGERFKSNLVEDASGPSLEECAERLAVKSAELEVAVAQVADLKRRNLELQEESRRWEEEEEEQRRAKEEAEQRGIVAAEARSPGLDVDGAVSKERHDTVCRDLSMQIAKNLEMEMRLEELKSQCVAMEDELHHERHRSELAIDAANRAARDKAGEETAAQKASVQLLRRGLAGVAAELKALRQRHLECRKEAEELPNRAHRMFKEFKAETFSAIRGYSEAGDLLRTRYLAEMKARKSLHDQLVRFKGNIRVFARIKPLLGVDRVVGAGESSGTGAGSTSNTSRSASSSSSSVSVDVLDDRLVHVVSPATNRATTYELDRVFGPQTTQTEVFSEVAPLVESLVDGFDVCIFAYGQTGSGKTHTMEGPPEDPGINQRALGMLFARTEEKRAAGWKYSVRVSMMEIYNDNLRDLLTSVSSRPLPSSSSSSSFVEESPKKKKLEVKKLSASPSAGQHVPGLVAVDVASLDDIRRLAEEGRLRRFAADTAMNHVSSRSHALLVVGVEGAHEESGEKTAAKMHLVDLAGSERVAKSGANGVRLKEAQSINRSLSALGEVIHALRIRAPHVPYRNSKLTYLLERSLAGHSKTLLLLQVAQEQRHLQETLQTLAFGQRAREVEATTTMTSTTGTTKSNAVKSTAALGARGKGNFVLRSQKNAGHGSGAKK